MRVRAPGQLTRFCISSAIFSAFTMCAQPPLFAQIASSSANPTASVPFVGCKSDGQVGPLEAPHGKNKVVPIPTEIAQQFAYYKSEYGFGILAPRGWYCFATYGSNGGSLYVSSQPISASILFSSTWKGFTGPAIQIGTSSGDTSGRFEVASIIARVFPAYRAFVRDVIAEGIEPASSFPSGPYPKDKLTYKSNKIVEYQTPPQTDGLGTRSRLRKNDDSIRGVAILDGHPPDLIQLSLRLPSNLTGLTSIIIQQVERDTANSHAR